MKTSKIRGFRNRLRAFERKLWDQLNDQLNGKSCSNVSLAQCHTILELGEQGRTTIGELAKSMGLDKSTLSRTIDSLVKKGLVDRVPNPSDRRYTLINLTKGGESTCKQINSTNDAYFERIFKAIPKGEHDKIIQSFELLVEAMNKKDESRKI